MMDQSAWQLQYRLLLPLLLKLVYYYNVSKYCWLSFKVIRVTIIITVIISTCCTMLRYCIKPHIQREYAGRKLKIKKLYIYKNDIYLTAGQNSSQKRAAFSACELTALHANWIAQHHTTGPATPPNTKTHYITSIFTKLHSKKCENAHYAKSNKQQSSC